MKVAIYSRKSRFTGKGESIGNQIQMCKDYLTNQYKDEENTEFFIYEDEGFSGSNTNRPEFQKLMNDVTQNKFTILICYRLDRISRNVADFSSTLETLQRYNIDFISIRDQFDTSSPMGRAMIYIASVFAQLERDTIAERVRDNMLELAKTGRWLGGVTPIGYKSNPIKYVDENMKERSLVKLTAVPEELKLVQLIFDKYIEFKSLSKVETYLVQNNFKSRRGNNFEKAKLRQILMNPVYVKATEKVFDYLSDLGVTTCGVPDNVHGLLRYNKQKSVTNKNGRICKVDRGMDEWIAACSSHNGIISDAVWIEAQNILSKNSDKAVSGIRTHNALLTGLLRCDKCGSPMHITYGHKNTLSGSTNYYYACTMKKISKGVKCNCKNVRVDDLDPSVINIIKDLGENKQKVIDSLIEKNKKNASANNYLEKSDNLDNLLAKKKKQIESLMEKLSLDDDLTDLIISKIKSLKSEVADLNKQLNDIKTKKTQSDEEDINIYFTKLLLEKCSLIDTLSRDEIKQLIDGLITTITWNTDTGDVVITPINSENIIESKASKKK